MAVMFFDKKQQRFWEFLNNYISDNTGFITSKPNTTAVRFECQADSILPELIKSMGFVVFNVGTAERLMPVTTIEQRGNRTFSCQSVGPMTMAVWEFRPKQLEAEDQSRLIK